MRKSRVRVMWLAAGAVLACALAAPAVWAAQAGQAGPAGKSAAVQAVNQGKNQGQAEAAAQEAYTLPAATLEKAIELDRIRTALAFGGELWGLIVLWLLLRTRAAAWMDARAARIARRHWVQGIVFFAALLVATELAAVPLDVVAQAASRAYGISVQSWAGWLGDEAKGLGLSIAIGAPVLLLFHRMVRRWTRRYWLAAWAAATALMVAGAFLAPLVIDPLFNQFEPLEKTNPALAAQLERVVERTGVKIPPDRMFLMKASAKTNGLNAYVTGIGATKRVVVWDTTAGRIPNDEVLFIFAHETGHYVLHHVAIGLALSSAGIFFLFWVCARFAEWMARRRGAAWGLGAVGDGRAALASRAGFVVLLLAVGIAGFLTQPAGNAVSRYFEHQADIYGQEAIHGIVPDPERTAVAAFNALGRAWLEDPHPNAFVELWMDTHPSTEQRAEFAEHYDPWKSGGRGKYFRQ
ncbi:MAG TPA: M48 family metallopeptidase [Terracidiphilus sp.]|nr:M48 family metallopeptidase [Terracidiphilus sp.]